MICLITLEGARSAKNSVTGETAIERGTGRKIVDSLRVVF